ncbi:MAG: hypothetical protein GY934_03480 [Gammaproteobacteria bacterium]|nr:hypothetical protein [Gammaproteobacteria bacterium]
MSLKKTALPRALPSTGITPLQQYYGPSDFLMIIPASSLTKLVCQYFDSMKNHQDLPRSLIYFTYMPCSQTPGTPPDAAHTTAGDVVFWQFDTIDHPAVAL